LEYSDVGELQNWQKEVAGSILNGVNVLSIAPTGSGKSHLGLWLTRRFDKVLWVLPTKALTREWFMRALTELRGLKLVNIYTGDYRRESNKYQGDLIFATYESALLQLRRKDEWFQNLELLIFDEFQFVGEDERGGVVEELLILLSELNPKTKILALSATVGNPEELVKWISRLFNLPVRVHELPLSQRPVKLVQQALKFKGEKKKRDICYILCAPIRMSSSWCSHPEDSKPKTWRDIIHRWALEAQSTTRAWTVCPEYPPKTGSETGRSRRCSAPPLCNMA